MAEKVVLFDFDQTIIDGDSDQWLIANMGMTRLYSELRGTTPWNSMMDSIIMEIQSQGKTISDIANCVRGMAIHPRISEAIKSAHALGCDLRIISDSNKFFIETILKQHEILECFSHIFTNPTKVDEDGRLRILSYHDLNSPHGCSLCPPNMCKGLVIDQMKSTYGTKTFIYVGDGGGDVCPTLRLSNSDHVMPRKDFALFRHIFSNVTVVKPRVHAWGSAGELKDALLYVISTT